VFRNILAYWAHSLFMKKIKFVNTIPESQLKPNKFENRNGPDLLRKNIDNVKLEIAPTKGSLGYNYCVPWPDCLTANWYSDGCHSAQCRTFC
jgi:hypothetical protein